MTEQEYRVYQELFDTEGWRNIAREAGEAIEIRKNRLLSAKSIDEVRFIQGEVAQLNVLVVLEEAIDIQYAAQKAAESEGDEE